MQHQLGWLGIVTILTTALLLSQNRRRISPRIVCSGLLLTFLIGIASHWQPVEILLRTITLSVAYLISFSRSGVQFLLNPDLVNNPKVGGTFLVTVVPLLIWTSALMSILHYSRALPRLIASVAWLTRLAFGPGITPGTACVAAATPLLGQTVAPLIVRPLLPRMTRSELMALMTCGFATMSAPLILLYSQMLERSRFSQAMTEIVVASIMSVPAALVLAKILVPEEESPNPHSLPVEDEADPSLIDAIAKGAMDGARLAITIAVMLLVFKSLLSVGDSIVGYLGQMVMGNATPVTLQSLLAVPFHLVARLIGVEARDANAVGSLIGYGVVSTEYMAFERLSAQTDLLSERSITLAIFALASFANIPSIAMQLACLSEMAPGRKDDLLRLAPRAMMAGLGATWLTACVRGLFL